MKNTNTYAKEMDVPKVTLESLLYKNILTNTKEYMEKLNWTNSKFYSLRSEQKKYCTKNKFGSLCTLHNNIRKYIKLVISEPLPSTVSTLALFEHCSSWCASRTRIPHDQKDAASPLTTNLCFSSR